MTLPDEATANVALLRHLAGEFGRLADAADGVQQAVAQMADRATPPAGSDTCWMIQLQALDSLSQVLRDLQRLATAAVHGPFARCRADAAFVRRNILLQSLAERLVGSAGHDGGHDPGAFLL